VALIVFDAPFISADPRIYIATTGLFWLLIEGQRESKENYFGSDDLNSRE
jgi:hypothetical protein